MGHCVSLRPTDVPCMHVASCDDDCENCAYDRPTSAERVIGSGAQYIMDHPFRWLVSCQRLARHGSCFSRFSGESRGDFLFSPRSIKKGGWHTALLRPPHELAKDMPQHQTVDSLIFDSIHIFSLFTVVQALRRSHVPGEPPPSRRNSAHDQLVRYATPQQFWCQRRQLTKLSATFENHLQAR